MGQARDAQGNIVQGVFERIGTAQVVAYTGTAGTIANALYEDTRATGTLTSNNTNVSNADTVTIGNKTYTFKTVLTPTEGEVLIGGDADASLLNLIRAINHSGTPDTDYSCAAAHTQVSAATAVSAHAFAVYALASGSAGNSIPTTEAAVTLSWGSTLLTTGEDDYTPRFVRVMTTTVALVKVGFEPTATSSDFPCAAGQPVVLPCRAGMKVSAIQSASGGNLHVVEVF